jgi:membrane protein implicated in regulation of membrane protease activity
MDRSRLDPEFPRGVATMKRYSILWWSIILPTSVVVGVPAFFVLGYLTPLEFPERVVVAIIATLAAELAIAASMEALAPTRLSIGPGEKKLRTEIPAEQATVISGFDVSPRGRVSVRGETWMATRLAGDSEVLSQGMLVRVVDRNGLELIVSSNTRQVV